MAAKSKLATALLSDMGRVRKNNEDAVGEDRDIGLLILADGMGGYNAGEIASSHYNREDAKKLVRKNIVTRALGVEPEVKVDVIEDPIEVGDVILICSDGLCDMVDDPTIGLTLSKFADNLPEAAKALITLAN